jgi:hypothetical protein
LFGPTPIRKMNCSISGTTTTTIAPFTHGKGKRRICPCHERRQSGLVSLASSLSRPIPDTGGCLIFKESRLLRSLIVLRCPRYGSKCLRVRNGRVVL